MKTIEGGLSGSLITVEGKYLTKFDSRSQGVHHWFGVAHDKGIKVPYIYEVKDDHIIMEYITGPTLAEKWSIFPLFQVLNQITHNYPDRDDSIYHYGEFLNYLNRVCDHWVESGAYGNMGNLIDLLLIIENKCDEQRSFCHGDLNLKNIILTDPKNPHHEVYLIDPIPMWGIYSSWLLDVSKLIQSIRYLKIGEPSLIYEFTKHVMSKNELDILVLTHDIRMVKYLKKVDEKAAKVLLSNIHLEIERLTNEFSKNP